MRWIFYGILSLLIPISAVFAGLVEDGRNWDEWVDTFDGAVVNAYGMPDAAVEFPAPPAAVQQWRNPAARELFESAQSSPEVNGVEAIGSIRARAQQALILEMEHAVRAGDVARAQAWRARLDKPRGTSSAEGALILQSLSDNPKVRVDAARLLTREAITWQTSRARQLLDEAVRSTRRDVPIPGRLIERFAEAIALADLPPALREAAGLTTAPGLDAGGALDEVRPLAARPWSEIAAGVDALRRQIEASLPSLLTDQERSRRERLLLKLVVLVPREYSAGVRDGQITVPLEYREAVTFTAQARQIVSELAPLWLASKEEASIRPALETLDAGLARADALIARKAPPDEVDAALADARAALEGPLGVSLRRTGSTAEIVEEVLLETRSLLNSSLAAALRGDWREAEQLRLEAYTTFDPDLEARLMPRDPQLALDIERLLLDGIDRPGVKTLLDRRAAGNELEGAYARVSEAMDRAGALLKSGVDPTAAAINAASIVLREGLEGLLVIVAILAGLRGESNRPRRRLLWAGVALSAVATLGTYVLSQTILSRLHAYAEVIEAITALLAIGVLLLITNWLFHQIYWNQWVTTLKTQMSEGESPWQLVSVGLLIGYREGFETVLFLQSLLLDVGGGPVGIGVVVALVLLVALGFSTLSLGLKLPYFKLLMITALLIGVVLVAFVGNGVRAMQTVGWLPVHRIFDTSWPAWFGQWLGLYNTWETIAAQVLITCIVLGTWRVSRWQAKRASAQRREAKARNLADAAVEVRSAVQQG